MSVTISGTDGISTPPVVVQGSTSGGITLAAPAVAGTNTQTLVAATGTLAPLISGTAVASTSGTSIDFTGIPSWVKRITVMFSGFSTSGASNYLVQLGDAGGFETTGYLGTCAYISSAAAPSTAFTTGLGIQNGAGGATTVTSGMMVISLLNSTTNTWTAIGNFINSDATRTLFMAGAKSLSDTLTQVRITTVNGTDTFDAGSINIMYE